MWIPNKKKKLKLKQVQRDIIHFSYNGLIVSILVPDAKFIGLELEDSRKITDA